MAFTPASTIVRATAWASSAGVAMMPIVMPLVLIRLGQITHRLDMDVVDAHGHPDFLILVVEDRLDIGNLCP